MSGKVVSTVREVIKLCGLRNGMTVSFHHHLRDGDGVLPLVMRAIADMGFRDIEISASSMHASHGMVAELIRRNVVTRIDTNFLTRSVGEVVSRGEMEGQTVFRTHGGRPMALESGESRIDIAFIAASAADSAGNMNGTDGPSAFGSMGYAFADARFADKVVVITDHLKDYPLEPASIDETFVDYVVVVESLGDTQGIKSGLTMVNESPPGQIIAGLAARVVEHSGYLHDGFNYQCGGGKLPQAVTGFVHQTMKQKGIQGGTLLGGVGAQFVQMLEEGLFRHILDVQCFDLEAISSIRRNAAHQEISCSRYANYKAKSRACDKLDTVILGATEIDMDFNVNVHTDSNGIIMGGSGGHSDIADSAKMTVIVAPLLRGRYSCVVERVTAISTPGHCVDVLVTGSGIAVNPLQKDLRRRLVDAGLPVVDIGELLQKARHHTGKPSPLQWEERVVAKIIGFDGEQIDEIRQVRV